MTKFKMSKCNCAKEVCSTHMLYLWVVMYDIWTGYRNHQIFSKWHSRVVVHHCKHVSGASSKIPSAHKNAPIHNERNSKKTFTAPLVQNTLLTWKYQTMCIQDKTFHSFRWSPCKMYPVPIPLMTFFKFSGCCEFEDLKQH